MSQILDQQTCRQNNFCVCCERFSRQEFSACRCSKVGRCYTVGSVGHICTLCSLCVPPQAKHTCWPDTDGP